MTKIWSIRSTRATCKHKNLSKCVFIPSNQTSLSINYHLSGPSRIFGELLTDFWSTGLNFDDFWRQIWPISPSGTPCKCKKPSLCVFLSSYQTYLPINYNFGGPRRYFGELLGGFLEHRPQNKGCISFLYLVPRVGFTSGLWYQGGIVMILNP